MIQDVASDVNKLKRQSYLTFSGLYGKSNACFAGDQLQKAIKGWLSPPDPLKNHRLACASRHEATATWFVQGDMFSEWKSSQRSSLLWIHGKRQSLLGRYAFIKTDEYLLIAGAGKSVFWYVNPFDISS
jgi:hypothetical protein